MSDIKVVRVDDGVEFHIHETKPYGIPDTQRMEKVFFGSAQPIADLPNEVNPEEYVCTILYWLVERGQWIGFNFTSYQERSTGPNEEDYYGPYLVPNEPPPTEEELAEAKEAGTLPSRCKKWQEALYIDGQLIKAHQRG